MTNQVNGKQKVTLITGIAGQDSLYLAEFLLEKGCIVHGIKRRPDQQNMKLKILMIFD